MTSPLEMALLLAGAGQLFIAGLGSAIPRILKWQDVIAAMPLLVREVFWIHTWFISLTCAFFGILTLRFAGELAAGPSAPLRWLAGGIALFWGIRASLQWLYYSHSHWRGNTARTIIHWTLFIGYGAWSVTFAIACSKIH